MMNRLLKGFKLPKGHRAVIRYQGPTDVTMPDLAFGGAMDTVGTVDCPMFYCAPSAGPMKGTERWKPLKKSDSLRMLWKKAGCPTGVFAVVGDRLRKIG
jgi:hypothetical protein